MDKNETKYELKLDAKDFIKQLQLIRYALEGIGKIVTQQSGKTYAIDVQIKNVDIQRFFERIDKGMDRMEKKCPSAHRSQASCAGSSGTDILL